MQSSKRFVKESNGQVPLLPGLVSQGRSMYAVAAINAAYYGGTAHDGFVRVDGVVKVAGGRNCSAFFANGAFVIDNNVD